MNDGHYNIKEEILKLKNYKINKEIMKEKEQLEKYLIYGKYLNETNFSALFRSKKSSKTPKIENTISTSTSDEQINVVIKGRTYDSSKMWSPVSSCGMVYEWNRGVMGINGDGDVVRENLDVSGGHHADATVKVVSYLGGNIFSTNRPFEAGVAASKEGIVLFQSEGNEALIYFPESMTPKQIEELAKIVAPRRNFNFSFTHKGEIFEEQGARTVIAYAVSIEKANTLKLR